MAKKSKKVSVEQPEVDAIIAEAPAEAEEKVVGSLKDRRLARKANKDRVLEAPFAEVEV